MRARTKPAELAEAQSLFGPMDGIQSTPHGVPKPATHGAPKPATHGAPKPATHGAPKPATHGAPQPATHGAPQPATHGAPQPATHGAPQPATHGVDGHRARMRTRLLTAGPDALADHEMLEMVLFLALPRRDTKPIARLLLNRFGSFEATISAGPAALMGVDGVGEAGAAALKLVQGASLRLLRHTVRDKPILKDWSRLLDYLTAAMAHEPVEQARVLFLDAKNRLLADEVQSRGTVNATMIYPREIVRRALELHATAFVLVHNHPSGDPTASREDMAMTKAVQRAAAALGIAVLDHIIVAGTRWLSFQREGWL